MQALSHVRMARAEGVAVFRHRAARPSLRAVVRRRRAIGLRACRSAIAVRATPCPDEAVSCRVGLAHVVGWGARLLAISCYVVGAVVVEAAERTPAGGYAVVVGEAVQAATPEEVGDPLALLWLPGLPAIVWCVSLAIEDLLPALVVRR